jgi:LPXTG-site transpeptidase (sortase) family protein
MNFNETDRRTNQSSNEANQLPRGSWFVVVCLILILLSSAVFITTLYHALHAATTDQTDEQSAPIIISNAAKPVEPTKSKVAKSTDGIIPHTFSIPSLHINTNVEQVGITAKGAIGIPSTFETVAWYKNGPKPGAPGKAIIDGHVNNGLGLAGVFQNLNKIQKGADIYVTDASGDKRHFTVRSISTVEYTASLDDIINPQTDTKPQLVIITCDGNWVKSAKTYDKRIVVVADQN